MRTPQNEQNLESGIVQNLTAENAALAEDIRRQFDIMNRSRDEIIELAQRYKLVCEGANEVLWDFNVLQKRLFVADRIYELLGYTKKEFYEKYSELSDVLQPEDYSFLKKSIINHFLRKNPTFNVEFKMKKKNTGTIHFVCQGKSHFDQNGRITMMAGSLTARNRKSMYEQEIRQMAFYDALTGLPNRYKVQEVIAKNCGNGLHFSIFFIDIDNFKIINDTYGHNFGDEFLKILGARLRYKANQYGAMFLGRLGGDEYVLVNNKEMNEDELIHIAKEFLTDFEGAVELDGHRLHTTCSIGITMYPEHGKDVNELIRNADLAMYEAKNGGKNKYVLYTQNISEAIQKKQLMGERLREAITNGEFQMHFQSIYDLEENSIVGYEGLIRWDSPIYGKVPPLEFIPLTEEMGLIIDIGYWVFRTCCLFAKEINEKSDHKLVVTVNVSPVQLMESEFVDTIAKILKDTETKATYIGIEITENTLLYTFGDVNKKLSNLHNMGFSILLDDFGTGYSSMSYLKQLSVDVIKVDKTFLCDIFTDYKNRQILESLISLVQGIGLKVLVEGVEEEAQYNFLKELNCQLIQGYYIGKPQPKENIRLGED